MEDPAFASEMAHHMRERARRVQWRRNKSKSMSHISSTLLTRSTADMTRRRLGDDASDDDDES